VGRVRARRLGGLGGVHALASALRGGAEQRTHTPCRPKQRRPEAAGIDVTRSCTTWLDAVVRAKLEGRDCAKAAT
jgi:hypothetical protein